MRVSIDLADVILIPAVERIFNSLGITDEHSIVCTIAGQTDIAPHLIGSNSRHRHVRGHSCILHAGILRCGYEAA